MTDTLPPTPAPQAGPSRTGPPSSRDIQAPPQPGDGAYLRWQQQQNGSQFRGRGRGNGNGQGQGYMGTQMNGRGRGQPRRGRGGFANGHGGQEGGRGGHDGQGNGQDIGQSVPGQGIMRQASPHHFGDNGHAQNEGGNGGPSHDHPGRQAPPHQVPHQVKRKANGPTHGQAHADGLPHRPQQPESMHGLAEAAPHQHAEASRGRGKSGERGQRGRGRGKGGNGPTASTPHVNGQTLDPGATSFQPLSAPPTPLIGTELLADDTIRTQSERGKPRPKSKSKAPAQVRSQPKTPDTPAAARTPMGNTRLSRKAVFDQGAKLTKTTSASSSGSTLEDTRKKETKNTNKDKKTAEADDLIDRLTRGLGKKPFFECPICYNAITPSQQIWCCLPPDGPPPSPFAPGIDVIDPKIISTHYQACFTPFHYSCVKDWSVRNYEEDKTRLRMIDSQEEAVWRCPGCQKRRADRIPPYRCFCGRMTNPPTNQVAPHSCADICSRKRYTCSHSCPLPCHPGPCPPCQVALVVPCPSHNYPLTVKCHMSSNKSTSMTPVCGTDCGRELSCGNMDHTCDSPCHYGPCRPCEVLETVRCYCGNHSKQEACGWNKEKELYSTRIIDGVEEHWKGRYNCGEPCDQFFDCGVHPCKETCHPHSVVPLPCPYSPSRITRCPCGATHLSELPNYPRPDCLASVPTCGQRCPKERPCGHKCPRTCHEGSCPPCHEEVVRPCRCGESQLVVGCDVLRERMEQGLGEMTCERVCKALRNCGRHECSRVCCPLSFQAKSKGKKRLEGIMGDDDLHTCSLTCGRMLGCGLHTCPKPDHKGKCGRCLQASYDELICHCGKTVAYPPVACGATINCQYACARPPPACRHPKTAHPCHESESCPPCPYLTTRACACGKDPAVKNIRCSQDRVSCGQICGTLLPCGFHTCDRSCHRPGECEPCAQTCGKPKRICRHPCTAQCHAPTRCPENDPCQYLVMQTCACGNLQSRTSCGASISGQSRETTQLKCNSECAIKQRNARLADALGINQGDRGLTEWNTELKEFATANLAFVKMVESTFKDFFAGQRQTLILPHMPASKRTFVVALADVYHLGRELIDQEPNRSVQIRRRIDTRIPNPLLSSIIAPPSVTAKLANLRTTTTTSTPVVTPTPTPAPWGKSTPVGLTPNSSHPNLATLAISQSQAEASGSGLNSARNSRPVTPAPPVLEVKGKVGEVDEVDWDED